MSKLLPNMVQCGTALPLLKGEEQKETFKDLSYHCPYSGAIKGTLILTNYRVYFKSDETDSSDAPTVLDMPLGFISKVDKMGGKREAELRGDKFYGLEIVCKDVRTLRFMMSKGHGDPISHSVNQSSVGGSRSDIVDSIKDLAFPSTNKEFALSYADTFVDDGWSVYNPQREYKRQNIDKNTGWQVTNYNERWEICETYPEVLVVPNEVSKEELTEVAAFRSKNRVTVLSWISKEGAAICRCSQPLRGPQYNRSSADESMVGKIMAANAASHRISIFDARPKRNAQANIIGGGGYEDQDHYEDMDFEFLEIHNIHVMRESLRKVKELCFPTVDDKKLFANIDNTQWLVHLSTIMTGVLKVVQKIKTHTSVIIHCSDGWDRTAQLTSLAMLLLDPYYRTIEGFIVLIEKEWLSFGHKFAHRIGHFEDKHNSNDRSPVFLQFVDCVWQVTRQFPFSFEFNEVFLIHILDHLYSCLFGTFLYNSERERHEANVRSRTQSLWSYVLRERRLFENSSFRPDHSQALEPKPDLTHFLLWKSYFLRWNPQVWTPDAKSQRKNNAKQNAIRKSLNGVFASLQKELEVKTKGGVVSTDIPLEESNGVDGISYRQTTPVVMSPTSSSIASSSASTATSSNSSNAKPPSTSPPSIGSSSHPPPPAAISPATASYYHNMTSTAAMSGSMPPHQPQPPPPQLPPRGLGHSNPPPSQPYRSQPPPARRQ